MQFPAGVRDSSFSSLKCPDGLCGPPSLRFGGYRGGGALSQGVKRPGREVDHLSIHSFCSLSYDRSVASSFCSLSYDRSVASSFCRLSYDRSVASSFCSLSYDRSVASSFCSLSYDRFVASFKASSPHSAI
jgi:hypothetical protein